MKIMIEGILYEVDEVEFATLFNHQNISGADLWSSLNN